MTRLTSILTIPAQLLRSHYIQRFLLLGWAVAATVCVVARHPVEYRSVPREVAEYHPIYLNTGTEQPGPRRWIRGVQTGDADLFYSAYSPYFYQANPTFKQDFQLGRPAPGNEPVFSHDFTFRLPIGGWYAVYEADGAQGPVLFDFTLDDQGLILQVMPVAPGLGQNPASPDAHP